MRVVHVDTGPTMRGGQWQVLLLARGLRARGVEQNLLARGELLGKLREEGFDVAEASWLRLFFSDGTLTHVHDARAHTWAAALQRRRLVVSRRVAFPVRTGALSQWKYAQANLYLAVSRFVAGRMPRGLPVRVVYDGAEVVERRAANLIVAPASDDPMKGSVLLRETGLPVKYSSNLKADLAEAKVFVYLSHEEGLGSAVLLAQSAGVPVVASRAGGLPEIVIHERTGLLTDNDPSAVRAAVERLLDDPALAARLGEAGRREFVAHYTVDHMVDATLAAYRDVLKA